MAKQEAPVQDPQEATIYFLDPRTIKPSDNIRLKLKESRLASLMEQVRTVGKFTDAIDVEPLDPPEDGMEYLGVTGHYRLEAALRLQKEDMPDIMVPATVSEIRTPLERLNRQISENVDREDLGPIGTGLAIQALLDQGVDKVAVRARFGRPGGRKGNAVQPLSNAAMNNFLTFLLFPKPVQTKIDDGRISVGAAYELARVWRTHPDKFEDTVAQIEADRLLEVEAEEKEEIKFLEAAKKEAEKSAKVVEVSTELVKTQEKLVPLKEQMEAKAKEMADAYVAAKAAPADKKEEASKALKAKEAEHRALAKEADKLAKETEKLEKKHLTLKEQIAERAKKLADAKKPKKSETTGEAVKKAAAKVGAGGPVPIKPAEFRKNLQTLALPGSYRIIQEFAVELLKNWDGITAEKTMYKNLSIITGEAKVKKAS